MTTLIRIENTPKQGWPNHYFDPYNPSPPAFAVSPHILKPAWPMLTVSGDYISGVLKLLGHSDYSDPIRGGITISSQVLGWRLLSIQRALNNLNCMKFEIRKVSPTGRLVSAAFVDSDWVRRNVPILLQMAEISIKFEQPFIIEDY